jgi:cardiolipin synthase
MRWVVSMRKECSNIAEIAAALLDAGAVDLVCDALISGHLTATCTSARRNAVALGSQIVESRLRDLQDVWRRLPEFSGGDLSMSLRIASDAICAERSRTAQTEVVWTGPRVETSYLRATRQVVLDILGSTKDELLVVGYWIAADSDPDGIVRQIVEEMAVAARRGARVRAVLDRTARHVGGSNRDLFLSLWPKDVDVPPLLTWRAPDDDVHLKLHAKVIIADRCDALVTSANLTMHAMDLSDCYKIT